MTMQYGEYYYLSHFTEEEIETQKKLSNFSKISQLLGGRVGIQSQAVWVQSVHIGKRWD